MTGSVLQVSVSHGGVPKRRVEHAEFSASGIVGDGHANPQIHGGPEQAVLLIAAEGIAELTAQGFPLFYGALGENITTQGIDRREWRAGQRWSIGPNVVIELTKLRQPCHSLNVYGPGIQAAVYDALTKVGDPSSPKWGLGGFYAAVMQEGVVREGDSVQLLSASALLAPAMPASSR